MHNFHILKFLIFSYLSWLNKPYNTFEEEQPYLTVCNIALPNNVMVFVDRGAQSDRWVHKRPRLRSAMQRKSARKSVQESGDNNNDEQNNNSDEEKDSEIMEIQQVNIKSLIYFVFLR